MLINKYTSFFLLSLVITVIGDLVFRVNLLEHILLPLFKAGTNSFQLEIQLLLLNSVFPQLSVRVKWALTEFDACIKVDDFRVPPATKFPLVSIKFKFISINGNKMKTYVEPTMRPPS
jgi:hypothetical protein